jgi:hypothetical protein
MAYIGREPQIGNFQVCDAISVVNGQAAYTMQVNSVNVFPETEFHVLCSVNGILQKSGSSFTISGSTITFASNLVTGDVIDFIHILGSVLDLGVPSDNTVSLAKLTATGTKNSTTFLRGDNTFAEAGGGKIVQIVNVTDGTTATGTTVFPFDNTIPQNTEGTEFMTLAITPTNSSNKLFIQVVNVGSSTAANTGIITALYQDTTANALAATMQGARQADVANTTTFNHYMTAGTTSATTFKVRAGTYSAGTYRFNGAASSGIQLFGGVMPSSITITEIEA